MPEEYKRRTLALLSHNQRVQPNRSLVFASSNLPLMNSSQLDPGVERVIVLYHHISDVTFFIVNFLVGLLIVLDKDRRGIEYRKYLLSLQVFSTLTDVFFTLGIPILVVNSRVIYNAGFNPFHIHTSTFLIIFFLFFTEIGSSYFSCAYYRRNAIFGRGYPLRWEGRRKGLLLVSVRLYALLAAALLYYCTMMIDTPDGEIPTSLNWVLTKPAHMVLRPNFYLFALLAVILVWGGSLFGLIVAVVVELSRQLNCALPNISPTTKRYQRRAVRSLKLQGAVPGIVYIIPVVGEFSILVYSAFSGSEEVAHDANVTTLSALLFNVISMHTFVHSITTLACSKSYQRVVLGLFCKARVGDANSWNAENSAKVRFAEAPPTIY
ncbi:hypothetical protein PENTCL1PPCAC_12608 [Pristionchus entomophagus]|uniref:G protein-coupled receptor n=1 Tax=Pristionchus entomophagus TaxID=358040 RepID=A0AAV5TCA4_9BILA|nr:hypothetical protein PENTCL1PPCAC_12608 [Pristionchus entomophagus]